MRSSKGWNEVVAEVERSGLNLQRQLKQQNHQRQLLAQKQLIDQMSIAINRKKEQERQKKNERLEIQANYRDYSQKCQKSRLQYKQKQEKMRSENLKMFTQKNHGESSPQEYKENPITATLYGKSQIRIKKQRDFKRQFDQINHQLARERIKSEIQAKRSNEIKDQQCRRQAQLRFKKIEQQRYKFQKQCLDGKYSTNKKLMTEPDSLEKQYSLYLEKQIEDHKRRPDNNIFRDKIFDQNLLKINHNPEMQSSSPAYLGRIPSHYDRQRQIQYLNKEFIRHQRTKTQGTPVSQVAEYKQAIEPTEPTNSLKLLPPIPLTPQIKNPQKQKVGTKNYKYFNIITGNMMVRSQGLNN